MLPLKPPPLSADEIEQQFYEALQHGDVDRLMALWADDEEVICVHPGGPRIVGHAAIRASFEVILGHGPIKASTERVRRIVNGDCAIHSVIEHISLMSSEGLQSARVLATNVYLRTLLGWRLVLHHATPGSTSEVQEVGEPHTVLH